MKNELYNKNLQKNLIKLINNSYDDINNFNLGYEYEDKSGGPEMQGTIRDILNKHNIAFVPESAPEPEPELRRSKRLKRKRYNGGQKKKKSKYKRKKTKKKSKGKKRTRRKK